MRRLTRGTIREAENILTLTRARTSGVGGGAVSIPQPTAQNEMLIASATPAWSLLAAPAAEGQVPITGADPYTPAWGTTFPTVIQFDAGFTLGGATGVNVVTVPDNTTQAMHIVDAGGIEYMRFDSLDSQPHIILNSGNADIDLIVRNDIASTSLFVRGSDGYVGIFTPTPNAPFHSHYLAQFDAGITLAGATTTNAVTIPDNLAQAVHLADTGGIEYLRIISTDAQPVVVFNDGGEDVDFRVEASGWGAAFMVQGSDGYVGVRAVPTAPFHVHGETLLDTGLTFDGAVPTPFVKVPDNAAIALRLVDAGDTEYLRIISTDAQPVVVFNEGGEDVDHRWEAVGQANALFIQGSDGFVALGHDAPERMLHIKGEGGSKANIILEEYQNTASSPDVFQRKGRGTIASPLDVEVDDSLGAWYFSGYRNSDWRYAAVIGGTVNALGTSVVRGGLSFKTANAAGTLVEQMTIDEDGNVGIGEPLPDNLLHLKKDTAPILKIEHTTTSSYQGIYCYEGANLKGVWHVIGSTFATATRQNDVEIYSVDGDVILQHLGGNVGIGTSAPLSELDVRGTISGIDELILSDITDLVNYITGPTNRSLTIRTGVTSDINDVLGLDVHTGAAYQRIMTLRRDGNVGIGTPTPGSLMEWNFATENLEFVDAGSAAATEQDWIEVQVGNVTGYIRVFAAK